MKYPKWRTKWHNAACVCRWCVYLHWWRRSEGVIGGKSSSFLTASSPRRRLHRCFRWVRKISPPPLLPAKDQSNMESSLCWGKMFTKTKTSETSRWSVKGFTCFSSLTTHLCGLYKPADHLMFWRSVFRSCCYFTIRTTQATVVCTHPQLQHQVNRTILIVPFNVQTNSRRLICLICKLTFLGAEHI